MFIFYYFRKCTLLLSVIFLVNNNKENSHLLVKYTLINILGVRLLWQNAARFRIRRQRL